MARSPLATVTIQANGSNYTTGRSAKISQITIHHMAGVLSVEQCGNVFARAGRGASAHYGVGGDGRIASYVDESDTAWSDANWASNCRTVSIETANSSTGGNWPVSDAAFDSLCKLVADVAKRNGLGTLVKGQNLCWHSMFSATTCLPVDTTELLTPNGWVRLADVSEGDMVASYRLDDGGIVFAPVRSVVAPYSASTWEFRDVEATADHRMIWRTQNGEYKITSLSEMAKYLGQVYIPNAGHYDGVGIDLSDSELKYLVAIQADGHYMKDKEYPDKPYGIEFHFKKQRKIDALIDILDELGKKYTLGDRSDGTKVIRIYGQEEVAWAEKYLSDKQFTWKFLQMNDHQAEIFLDAVLDFDGCRAGNDYSSSIKHNVDIVQAIAAIHNVGTRWSNDGTRVHFTNRERSVCLQGKLSGSATRHQNQLVGCVTVDTGLILIRQHGRTTVVGNCPGDYLRGKMDELARRANELMGSETPAPAPSTGKSLDQIANEVISGQWGNGDDRRNRLQAAGYNYDEVQALVNQKLGIGSSAPATKSLDTIANEVIAGQWGNGDDRRNRLQAAGYDYNAVQALVNQKLGMGSAPAGKSNEQIADEVIRGEWGNGDERRQRLQAAGYDYNAIQAIVNRKLG